MVNGFVAPIAPCSWTLPLPLSITRASLSESVPSMVAATVMLPPVPVPVVNVVVPALLRTIFPVLKDRSPPPVVTVGDTPVSRIVFPALAS